MVGLLLLGAALRRSLSGALYDTVTWTAPDSSELTIRCEVIAFSTLGYAAAQYLKDPIFSGGQGIMRIHPDELWPDRESTCDHPRLLKGVTLRDLGPADRTGMREGSVSWS
ncbi:hypothetical protein [Deinococcus marmoris]|uniref:hypothetical protein n=1 Tax=Deinococcus marmoris TaxID=249408 RepID=UPI00096ACAB2|nr:hypothetical protein [Deinococcus marmoris]